MSGNSSSSIESKPDSSVWNTPRLPFRKSALVLGFSSIGHFFAHYFPVIFATALVVGIAPEWNMPEGELLSLAALGLALYGIGAIPASWMGDRGNQIILMIVFFVGCGLAACLISISQAPIALQLGLGLLGLCGSIYHPVGIAWLVTNAEKEKRGMALGINGIFGSIGLALAPIITEELTYISDWRLAFQLPALFSIGVGILLWLVWRTGHLPQPTRRQQNQFEIIDWKPLIRLLFLFCCAFVVGGMIYQTTSLVMPILFADRLQNMVAFFGLTTNQMVSVVYIFAGIANFVGGWLADRFDVRRVYLACWLLQIPALFGLSALFEAPLLLVTSFSVFLSIVMLPAENMLLTNLAPQQFWARIFGLKFIMAFGLSASAIPIAGFIYDQTGYFSLFFVCLSLVSAFLTACLFLIPTSACSSYEPPQMSRADYI